MLTARQCGHASGSELAPPRAVAKFRVVRGRGTWRIVVRGALRAPDLRRLEQACGPGLESATASVEIRLDPSVEVDEPARFFLEALRKRGATIVQ